MNTCLKVILFVFNAIQDEILSSVKIQHFLQRICFHTYIFTYLYACISMHPAYCEWRGKEINYENEGKKRPNRSNGRSGECVRMKVVCVHVCIIIGNWCMYAGVYVSIYMHDVWNIRMAMNVRMYVWIHTCLCLDLVALWSLELSCSNNQNIIVRIWSKLGNLRFLDWNFKFRFSL